MPRPGALREDEGVFAPPAFRGCAGERAGKQVRKSPAAIGNAAWMRFLEVFSPEELGRSSAGIGSLAPRTSSPAARVSRSHPGWLCAIPPNTCPRETHPRLPAPLVLPKWEAAEPNPRPQLHLLLFLLHLHPAPPRLQSLLPRQLLGVQARHSQGMQIPKLTLGDWSRSRHRQHRPAAVLGSQPGEAGFQAKRGREKPLLNRKRNSKGRRGGRMPSAGRRLGLKTTDPSIFQRFEAQRWLR